MIIIIIKERKAYISFSSMWDISGADWYEALPLPDIHTMTYVVETTCVKLNRTRLKAEFSCKLLNRKFLANPAF